VETAELYDKLCEEEARLTAAENKKEISLQIGLQAEHRDFENLKAEIAQTRADINLTHLII
tara:strand:- start:195 stop:377 length:183 start_codon:yes stop_codon:yes gene_type:complete